jgi:hypothetical protein
MTRHHTSSAASILSLAFAVAVLVFALSMALCARNAPLFV